MENSVSEEEIHPQTKSTDLAAKSSGSIINIDSMVVDISIPGKKNETGNCRHFSIRGYVAEMREKNRRTCELFASGTSRNLEAQLPHLLVPRHRYWRCEGCLPEICTGCPTKDGRIVSRCWQNGLVSVGTCVTMPSSGDAAATPSEMHQIAAMDISQQSKIHIDVSPPRINPKIHGSLASFPGKEISANTREMAVTLSEIRASTHADNQEMAFTGDENGSGNVKNQKNGGGTLIHLQLNSNEVHCMDPNFTGPDAHDTSPFNFRQCTNGISSEICFLEKMDTMEDQEGAAQASDTFTNNTTNEPVHVGVVKSTRTPSVHGEERENASSDSEGTLAGRCRDRRQPIDDISGLPRRKTRKVRLLTDLLNVEGSSEIDRIRKDNTSFNAVSSTSTGFGSAVSRKAQDLNEDICKDKQSPPRKRKISNLDDSRSLEIRGIANISKKVRSTRVSSEKPHMTNEVSNLESEESHRSKYKNRAPSLFKKKMLIQVNSEVGNNVADGALEQSVSQKDTSNVPSSSCRRPETNKCFNLFKGKRPEIENGETSLSPANYSNSGEAPTQANQTESIHSVSGGVQFQPENDASSKVCLDLSLGRPLSSEGTDKDNICKTNPAFLQQNRPGRYPHWRNKNVARQLSELDNSSASQAAKKGLPLDMDGRILHRTGITLEKQTCSGLFEKRGFTLQERMDKRGQHEEVQGQLEASGRQNDHRSYKAFEKGSSDDIPMEIVELMAKNQYERQMAGGEGQSLSTNMGSVRVHGNHSMKWLPAQSHGMMNIPHTNSTKGIAVAVENRVAAAENAINFSNADKRHFKLNHLEGNQVRFFDSFSENQQKLSCGVQFPVSGSTISGSRPSEGAIPVWLSKNQHMPFGLGIPQKYTTLPNNIEAHARFAETQHKGRTISDIKAEEMKMQESHIVLSRAGGGELYLKPRGSLDSYSNESIPAMQLLSLMDKGVVSNAALDADRARFNEVPFTRYDYHKKSSIHGSHNVLDRSFLSDQHQRPGFYCAGESSSRPSSFLSSQMSFRSQKLEEQLGVNKGQKSFPRSGGFISEHLYPQKDKQHMAKQKGILYNSNSLRTFPQFERLENSPRVFDLEANNASGASLASKQTLKVGPCSFNQNPADFSVPEPGNKYTITGEDLIIRKKDFYRERSHSIHADSRKRLNPSKVSTGKKHARHHAS